MFKMLLKKISLRNLRSYENAEIEFPLGSTLFSGDIGSGKTSVLLAVEFALFGLQPGQRGSSLLRNGKKEGRVSLEFDVDGKQFIIERSLKKGKTVSQEKVSLEIDGKKQEMSILELKNFVLNILNYPSEFRKKTNLLYRFTVYTPQEEMKQIVLEDRETRLNTLRHIFGIDKYKRVEENTEIITGKLREISRNKEGVIADLDNKKILLAEKEKLQLSITNKLSETEKSFQDAISKRKSIEKEKIELEEKINEKNNLANETEKTKIMIIGKKEMLSSLAHETENLKKEVDEASKIKFNSVEIEKTEEKIKEDEKEEKNLREQYVELAGKINFFKAKSEETSKLKSQITKITICPTCLQNVDDSYRYNILNKCENELKESERNIIGFEKEKKEREDKLNNLKEELSKDEGKISELKLVKIKLESLEEKKKKISELSLKKIAFEKDVKLLEQHINSLRDIIVGLSKFENLFKLKEQELESARKYEKEVEINRAELNKEIELIKKQISEFEQEIKEKENVKKELGHITEMENWLSTNFLDMISFTERNVMLRLREEFSKIFNEWFSILVSAALTGRVDEDFTPIIQQQDYEIDYAYLSGGERTAVALAYRLALNQVINSILSKIKTKELVILDEPTDGFSEQQLDKVRDVLQQLNVKQLILVSHEPKIESFVENIIRFKKENDVTRVS